MSLERLCESLGKNHAYSQFCRRIAELSIGRELTILTFYGCDGFRSIL